MEGKWGRNGNTCLRYMTSRFILDEFDQSCPFGRFWLFVFIVVVRSRIDCILVVLWTRHYLRVERRTAEDDVAGGHREQRGWQLDVYQKEVIIEYSDSMYILSYLIDPLLLGHSLVWCSSLSLVPTENLIRRLADCRSQSHFHSRSLVWWICQLCGNVDPESFSQAIWSRLASIDIAFGWTLARPKAGLQTNTDDVQT